jgi:ubiquinone/menaquinone biosynthesis C-methylase UbiE
MPNVSKREWEQIEVERSSAEASHIDERALAPNEKQIARYLDPPSETYYPLEYSFHLLGEVQGKRLLEYGCGDGLNTVVLTRRRADVISLDISDDLINVARRRVGLSTPDSSVKFVVGSAHDLPIADESIDIVFGMAILHHLDLPASSAEVYRVLKKGGRAIFQEPIRNSRLMAFLRNLIPFQQADLSPFERPLTDAELATYAEAFSSCKVRSFSLPFVNLIEVLGLPSWIYERAVTIDRTFLDNFSFLQNYATVKVYEISK